MSKKIIPSFHLQESKLSKASQVIDMYEMLKFLTLFKGSKVKTPDGDGVVVITRDYSDKILVRVRLKNGTVKEYNSSQLEY